MANILIACDDHLKLLFSIWLQWLERYGIRINRQDFFWYTSPYYFGIWIRNHYWIGLSFQWDLKLFNNKVLIDQSAIILSTAYFQWLILDWNCFIDPFHSDISQHSATLAIICITYTICRSRHLEDLFLGRSQLREAHFLILDLKLPIHGVALVALSLDAESGKELGRDSTWMGHLFRVALLSDVAPIARNCDRN